MAPFYWLSQQAKEGFARTFILKISLAIWAALLGLQFYLLARDLWPREGLALGLWALYAFSTPVLFYAIHLYPEIFTHSFEWGDVLIAWFVVYFILALFITKGREFFNYNPEGPNYD